MSQKKLRFPDEFLTDVKHSMLYTIENADIATEEDLNHLVELMFQYPERNFYLFGLKMHGANHLVVSAEQHGILLIERSETQYYPHPKLERDWVRIDKQNPKWDWEKKAIEHAHEYTRFTLKLTERWRRKMDLNEALSANQAQPDKNPLLLKPNFFGVGIDLPKAWSWLKEKWRKQDRRAQ